MHLPCPYALQKNHHMTVLDGELVTDIISSEKEPNQKLVRFLIYDAMRINNQSVMELNLLDRLSIIYTDVILPRLQYIKMYPEKIKEEKENNSFLDIYLKVQH
jgi:mRNA guanylyltransferase